MRSERHASKHFLITFHIFVVLSACIVFQKDCCPRVKGVCQNRRGKLASSRIATDKRDRWEGRKCEIDFDVK